MRRCFAGFFCPLTQAKEGIASERLLQYNDDVANERRGWDAMALSLERVTYVASIYLSGVFDLTVRQQVWDRSVGRHLNGRSALDLSTKSRGVIN